jgi:hypothetical protein
MACGRQSKAFERSIRIAATYWFLSRATRLKEAQVVPLHKKNDPLDKKNYRPVSILPTISKVYEMVFSDQLTDLFENKNNLFANVIYNIYKKGVKGITYIFSVVHNFIIFY